MALWARLLMRGDAHTENFIALPGATYSSLAVQRRIIFSRLAWLFIPRSVGLATATALAIVGVAECGSARDLVKGVVFILMRRPRWAGAADTPIPLTS
jgi:hypothetical protein